MNLPRVTAIIKATGLTPPYPAGNYLEKGTAVDMGSRLLFAGHKVEDLEIDDRIRGYLISLQLWLEHSGFQAERIQPEYVSTRYGFCGHPDVHSINELWDVKTGSPAKHYRLQLAGYQILINESDDFWIQKRGCLYLKEDGEMAKAEPHNDRADIQAFLSALKLYQGEQALERYRENLRKWKEQ